MRGGLNTWFDTIDTCWNKPTPTRAGSTTREANRQQEKNVCVQNRLIISDNFQKAQLYSPPLYNYLDMSLRDVFNKQLLYEYMNNKTPFINTNFRTVL